MHTTLHSDRLGRLSLSLSLCLSLSLSPCLYRSLCLSLSVAFYLFSFSLSLYPPLLCHSPSLSGPGFAMSKSASICPAIYELSVYPSLSVTSLYLVTSTDHVNKHRPLLQGARIAPGAAPSFGGGPHPLQSWGLKLQRLSVYLGPSPSNLSLKNSPLALSESRQVNRVTHCCKGNKAMQALQQAFPLLRILHSQPYYNSITENGVSGLPWQVVARPYIAY